MTQHGISKKSKVEGGLRTRGIFKSSTIDSPLITIVTVVYNGGQHLEQAILSVLDQTWKNIEYIIIDGGSNDNTLEIIQKYDNLIDYWVSEPDSGIYDAMNKGYEKSLGDYIGFINSDDYLYIDAIAQLAAAAKVSRFGFTIGDIDIVSKGGVRLETSKAIHLNTNSKNYIYHMATPHQSFYISRELLIAVGVHDLKFPLRADFDLVIRAIKSGSNYYRFESPIAAFRLGGVSGSYDTYLENFPLMMKHGAFFPAVLFITITSLIKVFIMRNFPTRITNFLRNVFGSNRCVRPNS